MQQRNLLSCHPHSWRVGTWNSLRFFFLHYVFFCWSFCVKCLVAGASNFFFKKKVECTYLHCCVYRQVLLSLSQVILTSFLWGFISDWKCLNVFASSSSFLMLSFSFLRYFPPHICQFYFKLTIVHSYFSFISCELANLATVIIVYVCVCYVRTFLTLFHTCVFDIFG